MTDSAYYQYIAANDSRQVLGKNIQPDRNVTKLNTRYLAIAQKITLFLIYLFSRQVV